MGLIESKNYIKHSKKGEIHQTDPFRGCFITPEGQEKIDRNRKLLAAAGQDPFYGCFLTPEAQARIDVEHERRLQADEGKGIFDGLFVRAQDSDLDGYEIYPNKED